MRISLKHLLIGVIFTLVAANAQATMLSGSSYSHHYSGGWTGTGSAYNGYGSGYGDGHGSSANYYGFGSWSAAANWWSSYDHGAGYPGQMWGSDHTASWVDVFKWKLCYFTGCCSTGGHPGEPSHPGQPTDPDTPPADVPAPGSGIALFGLALVGLMAWVRRRRGIDPV